MGDALRTLRISLKWLGFIGALSLALVSVSKGILNPAQIERPAASLLVFLAGFLWLAFPRTGDPTRLAVARLVFDSRRRSFNLALFCVATIVASAVSWLLFQGVPHLDDSVSALFQAKIFSSGRLTIPIPDGGEFFSMTCNIDARHGRGHLCSMYPPGHPAVLLPGVLFGVPWLVTPLFGGALAVATHELARRLYGRRVGRLAGLFTLFSPFVLMLAGSHLSHLPTAFFLVACMWSVCRLRRTTRWGFGWAAGAFFAAAFLTRPLTALGVGVVIALGALTGPGGVRRRWKGLVAAGLVAMTAAGAMAAWQNETTGDWRTPGHTVSLGDLGRLGFRDSQRYTPRVGWEHTRLRLQALNHQVLGWPVPLFVVALLPFLLFRARREDVWLLLAPLVLLGLYWLYYYYEFFFPARYIFAGVPMLLILAARGYDVVARGAHSATSFLAKRTPGALLAGCMAFLLLVYSPMYFSSIASNHGDVEAQLAKVVRDSGIRNALVFVTAVGRLAHGTNNDLANDFYATGFLRNNLTFDGEIVYARGYAGQNHRLAARYPGRGYYLYRYNRANDRGRLFRMSFEGERETLEPVRIRRRDKARRRTVGSLQSVEGPGNA